MKDKAFARSVNREDIVNGARELGVELDEHIDFCVKAMQERADSLGLKGSIWTPRTLKPPYKPSPGHGDSGSP
jgi:hypothetical protein